MGLSPEAQRFYPGGALAGPLLGVAGLDGNGLEGVELSLDEHLSGDKAHMPVLRDARGATLLSGWDEADAHAVAGRTVVLTIASRSSVTVMNQVFASAGGLGAVMT